MRADCLFFGKRRNSGQGTLLAMPSFISNPLQRAPVGNCSPAAAPCLHPFLNAGFRDIFGLSAETANNMSNCNGMFVSLAPLGKDGAEPGRCQRCSLARCTARTWRCDLPGELLRAGAERLELQLGLTLPCSPGAYWGQL